jgi:hypothetical protein
VSKNKLIKKPAAFMLGLFFDHEDGGDMFLRNIWLSEQEHYNPEDK